MGTLPPTPTLGLVLPDPGTAQQHSTAVQNGWFQGIDTAIGADRARLTLGEKLTLPGAPSGIPGVVPAGTTAQRNTFWGVPATAADRVLLAGKGARWFNTELGYEEQYFSNDDDAGANLKLSAATAGWYPIGSRMKPYVVVDKDIAQNAISGVVTVSWSATDAQYDVYDMYSTAQNTRLTAPIAGLYRASYSVRSSGVSPYTVNAWRTGAIYGRGISSDVGAAGAGTSCTKTFPVYMAAGDYLELQVTSTATTPIVNLGGNCYFELEYIGPAPS